VTAKDTFHEIVKIALQKDGWQITHDPYTLQAGTLELYIDLGAEKVFAAEKEGKKIAVEIKSFLGASKISQFYTALGQFMIYRAALHQQEIDRILYLAVPSDVYDNFLTMKFIQSFVQQNQIYLIVYNPEQEAIAQWQI
jgi:hypothetical protein